MQLRYGWMILVRRIGKMPTKFQLLFHTLSMKPAEQDALANALESRYVAVYVDGIQQQLDRLGVRWSARIPAGQEARQLREFAERDAESIVQTYNRELSNQIEQLLLQEVDFEVAKAELRQWHQTRQAWKVEQISRATRGNAGNYAIEQFIKKNNLFDARVIWFAIPAIVANSHKECIRRVGLGAVDWQEAKSWELTSPNCRHVKLFLQQDVNFQGEVWRG